MGLGPWYPQHPVNESTCVLPPLTPFSKDGSLTLDRAVREQSLFLGKHALEHAGLHRIPLRNLTAHRGQRLFDAFVFGRQLQGFGVILLRVLELLRGVLRLCHPEVCLRRCRIQRERFVAVVDGLFVLLHVQSAGGRVQVQSSRKHVALLHDFCRDGLRIDFVELLQTVPVAIRGHLPLLFAKAQSTVCLLGFCISYPSFREQLLFDDTNRFGVVEPQAKTLIHKDVGSRGLDRHHVAGDHIFEVEVRLGLLKIHEHVPGLAPTVHNAQLLGLGPIRHHFVHDLQRDLLALRGRLQAQAVQLCKRHLPHTRLVHGIVGTGRGLLFGGGHCAQERPEDGRIEKK
mmetsp:Transcript_89585/g.148924  ORF Transcript_89585/g.148924 Transcript_89585/m.148924 type:complete len:343 (-) Transcript_89585:8-1036(-)